MKTKNFIIKRSHNISSKQNISKVSDHIKKTYNQFDDYKRFDHFMLSIWYEIFRLRTVETELKHPIVYYKDVFTDFKIEIRKDIYTYENKRF